LGEVGIHFAAGMSGGIAYVYDAEHTLENRYNSDMVSLEQPSEEDLELIHSLIEEHVERTKSPRGIKMLYQFDDLSRYFVKVIPHEYKKALELTREAEKNGASHEDAVEIAFEQMRKGE